MFRSRTSAKQKIRIYNIEDVKNNYHICTINTVNNIVNDFVCFKYKIVRKRVVLRTHNPKVAGSSPAPATK